MRENVKAAYVSFQEKIIADWEYRKESDYDYILNTRNFQDFEETLANIDRQSSLKLEELFEKFNYYYKRINELFVVDIKDSIQKGLEKVFNGGDGGQKRVAWNPQVIETLNEAETLQLIEILTRTKQNPEKALQSLSRRDFALLARLIDGHVDEIMQDIMA